MLITNYNKFMFFDVESVGLHGEGFAVGWMVLDRSGSVVDASIAACDPALASGDRDGLAWVYKNVPAHIYRSSNLNPSGVRSAFWAAWSRHRVGNCGLVAECPIPVESNFLRQCIEDDLSRESEFPYPLLDVASIRAAAGLDPLETCSRKPAEQPAHDPLADAYQSARLFTEALIVIRQT